jgi:PHD/YefM family antitoxin component YafN of YafNO toxin-antitoxin module
MIALPKEIRDAVRSQREPIRLTDPDTQQEYVVVAAEKYDSLAANLFTDEPLSPQERQQLLVQAGLRAGWDDSAMDVYNDLDPRRQK